MRLPARPSYANVTATLALFFALTGTAVAGGALLVTGADVKDRSLTGADIRRGSLGLATLSPEARARLTGAAGPAGAQGAKGEPGAPGAPGAQGPAGAGVTTATVSGTDMPNYVDLTPLASGTLGPAGDYVVFTTLTVRNTGGANEYLNCGYRVDGTMVGAAGVETSAGGTASGSSVGAFHAAAGAATEFLCAGSGGTTYDIEDVEMRIHFLG
jgi:hypothetical protein